MARTVEVPIGLAPTDHAVLVIHSAILMGQPERDRVAGLAVTVSIQKRSSLVMNLSQVSDRTIP